MPEDRQYRRRPQHEPQVVSEFGKLQPQDLQIEEAVLGALMLEKDAYCPDILTQSAAVNAAVNAFNKELLASHIRHCVVRDVKNGDETVIDELVATIQKLMK